MAKATSISKKLTVAAGNPGVPPAEYFAGRQQELERLSAHLKNVGERGGQLVLVRGEKQIGKTALIEHFSRQMPHQDALFLSENFKGSQAEDPYRPFWNIIKNLEQAGILKQQRQKRPADNTSAKQDKTETYDAETFYSLQFNHRLTQQHLVSRILEGARQRKLMILIDDAQFASQSAWQFIHYLGESMTEHQILLIIVLEDTDRKTTGNAANYRDVLSKMNRKGLIDILKLAPFKQPDIRQLLFQIFQRKDFSNQLTNLLFEISCGIPGQLLQAIQLLQKKGYFICQKGIWYDQKEVLGDSSANFMKAEFATWNAALSRENRSQFSKTVLEYAALFEKSFDHLLLSAVLDQPRLTVLKELLFLKEQGMLCSIDEDTYRFKFPANRLDILEKISASRKIAMHEKIASALEKMSDLDIVPKTFLLSYHFRHAGKPLAAFRYSHEAGRQAMSNFAILEAREFYAAALTILKDISEEIPRDRQIQLFLEAAWIYRFLGYWKTRISLYKNARRLCKKEKNRHLTQQTLVQMGLNYFQLNDWKNAYNCFEKYLEDSSPGNDFLNAMTHYGLGNIAFELADYTVTRQHYKTALQLAEGFPNKHLAANLLNNLGALENVCGNRLRAITVYTKSIPLFKAAGDKAGLARVYNNIGMTYADERDWEQALGFYSKSLGVSDAMGLISLKSITFLNRALSLVYLNQIEEAKEYNNKAFRLLRRINDQLGIAEYYKIQGMIKGEQAEFDSAQKFLDKAFHTFEKLKNKLGKAEVEFEFGLLAVKMKNPGDAGEWLEQSRSSFSDLGLTQKTIEIEGYLEELALQKN